MNTETRTDSDPTKDEVKVQDHPIVYCAKCDRQILPGERTSRPFTWMGKVSYICDRC